MERDRYHSTARVPRFPFSGREGWEERAACRGVDSALFFGPNRFEPKNERLAREEAAKAICARCPVIEPCQRHALANGEAFGVWGGLGESDRRGLRAKRAV